LRSPATKSRQARKTKPAKVPSTMQLIMTKTSGQLVSLDSSFGLWSPG
jgi:hypothetical protein